MILPPYLASEISGRLAAMDPSIREAFAADEFTLPGEALERLLRAVWLVGYSEALTEMADRPKGEPLPALAKWIEEHMLSRVDGKERE